MEYYRDTQKYSSVLWTDLYRPTNISELVGNSKSIQQLIGWLKNFNRSRKEVFTFHEEKGKKGAKKNKKDLPKSSVVLAGPHGVGKSITVMTVLRELGYEIKVLNFDRLKEVLKSREKKMKGTDKKDKGKQVFNRVIEEIVTAKDVISLVREGKSEGKYALMIDEIETINASIDKKVVTRLIKLNDQRWFFPVIMVSNNQHNKLLTEIKKGSEHIRLWSLFDSDMRKILVKIARAEGIRLANERVAQKIITIARGDIRQLIHTIQSIFQVYGREKVTEEMVAHWEVSFQTEEIDDDLYEAAGNLLRGYRGISYGLRSYESEKVLIPLMMHQNYDKYISTTLADSKEGLEVAEKMAESFSMGDLVENYIYGNQIWNMQMVHGFDSCVYPSYCLNRELDDRMGNPRLTFPQDLNKNSIMRINNRNIGNANGSFSYKSVTDYLSMNQLINQLLLDDRLDEAIELLGDYDLKKDHLESLLKIDKITSADDLQQQIRDRGVKGDADLKKAIKEFTNRKKEFLAKVTGA